MKKIGITGSIASGKTTASKILSGRKGSLFSADLVVKNLYRNQIFKKKLAKKLNIDNTKNLKNILKEKLVRNGHLVNKLEKIIHPLVRKEMSKFSKKNKKRKMIFFEIPLLVESNLMKNFDVIIFIKAKKSIRLKRFKSKGGDKKLFKILDKKQLSAHKKINFCDHIVVNEKNIKILKKKLLYILKNYE